MRFPLFKPAVAFSALLTLAGCSQLTLFDTFVPKDRAEGRTVTEIAYAEHPRGRLDIYGAEDGADKPVLFFVYGGSWSNGRKEDYTFVGRAFAARGYVTVIADYRLVPEVRYPDFLKDGAAALAWTYRHIGRFGGDPERLFVVGHSAGAYNALMLAMAPELLEAEGLDTSIIDGVAGLSGPYDFLPLDDDSTIAAFGKAPDLPATQPVNRPAAGTPPTILVHGGADDLVFPRNSKALARHLEEAGVPTRLVIHDGIGHATTVLALSRLMRGRAPVLEEVDGFFKSL